MHSIINMDLYILWLHKRELLWQIQTWKFTRMFQLYRASALNTFKNIELELLNSPQSFSFFFSFPSYLVFLFLHPLHTDFHFCSSTYTKTKICFSWKLPTYIKDCNNYLPRNLSSEI